MRIVTFAFMIFLALENTPIHTNKYKTESLSPLPLSGIRYWAYQIQALDTVGAVDALANSRYDMIVVDPTVTHDYSFNARNMVQKIKASKASDGTHRKLVIAYIDIGQAEEWRWYWDGHTTYEHLGACQPSYISQIQMWAPWVVACDPDGWAGNYPVAYWHSDWKDVVIYGTTLGSHLGLYFNSLLDEVIQDGFDGIYLDWVEAWEMTEVQQRAQNEGKNPGQEMLTFIQEMRAYGKLYNPNFLVIQQNSSELINEVGVTALKTAVDAIAQEGVWWEGDASDNWNDPNGYDQPSGFENYYLPRLRLYKTSGLPVFVCEYAVSKASDAYQKARAEGFIAYATRRSLSQLTTTPPFLSSDLIGTWDGSGVWCRNSNTAKWTKMAPWSHLVAAGDLDGDSTHDVLWSKSGEGVWAKSSSTLAWTKLCYAHAWDMESGDMNGDGRDDLVGIWPTGVYYKSTIGGTWAKIAAVADDIAIGDIDGDGKDDILWNKTGDGVWVKKSLTGTWTRFCVAPASDITSGDMNGDGRDDLVGIWPSGVYYKNSVSGAWTKIGPVGGLIGAGDLDGDGTEDLLWSNAGDGVWVKYSSTMSWMRHHAMAARHICAGDTREGTNPWPIAAIEGLIELPAAKGGYKEGPGCISDYEDLSDEGPGGWNFVYTEEANLVPQDTDSQQSAAIPGPGEPGFQYIEQMNLVPPKDQTNKKDKRNNLQ
jgi:cysteinyl-tRNA synthetase